MSIASRLKTKKKVGIYGVVAGLRLSGKSSLAGTAPGKTLLLQAELLETASESAKSVASRLGNTLDVLEFTSAKDMMNILDEVKDTDYDNIYIDGLSAMSDMISNTRDIQQLMKKNTWDAFREIGTQLCDFQLKSKQVSIDTGKNVFTTLALKPKTDTDGHLVSLDPVIKGQVALESIKKLAPVVISLRQDRDENGKLIRNMLTNSDGLYPARIDAVLDDMNPGKFRADDFSDPSQAGLAGLINFLKGL